MKAKDLIKRLKEYPEFEVKIVDWWLEEYYESNIKTIETITAKENIIININHNTVKDN